MKEINHGDEIVKRACEEISYLISESLERKLNYREQLRIRLHFLMCSACKYYGDNITKLHQVLKLGQKQTDELLPQDKREKIERIFKDVSH